jgi:hypothetical protein
MTLRLRAASQTEGGVSASRQWSPPWRTQGRAIVSSGRHRVTGRLRHLRTSRTGAAVGATLALAACGGSGKAAQHRGPIAAPVGSVAPVASPTRTTAIRTTTVRSTSRLPTASGTSAGPSAAPKLAPASPRFLAQEHAREVKVAAGLKLRVISAKIEPNGIALSYDVTVPQPQQPGWPQLLVYVESKGSETGGPEQTFRGATGGQVHLSLKGAASFDHVLASVADVQGRRSPTQSVKLTRP